MIQMQEMVMGILLIHLLREQLLLLVKKLKLLPKLKTVGLKLEKKVLTLVQLRKLLSVQNLKVGISVFSLKFLRPSVEKWSNLPLSWRMGSPLTLVNWYYSPQTEKVGNILGNGLRAIIKLIFHKIQTIYLVQTLPLR